MVLTTGDMGKEQPEAEKGAANLRGWNHEADATAREARGSRGSAEDGRRGRNDCWRTRSGAENEMDEIGPL